MNNLRLSFLAITCISALSACVSTEETAPVVATQTDTPLLRSLSIEPVRVEPTAMAPADLQTLRDGYAELAGKIADPTVSQQLKLRLGDLEMLLAERKQVDGSDIKEGLSPQQTWQEAVDTYEDLLATYPGEGSQAEILYQLARAYDLQGQPQKSTAVLKRLIAIQPDSLHAPEAWFRQGEALYSAGNYAAAAEAYQKGMDRDPYSSFYSMSAYMMGWAFFKMEMYPEALDAFDKMLTGSFATLPDAAYQFNGQPPKIDMLPIGQQKLVRDALRVMALLFSYQGDGVAIANYYFRKQEPAHSYLIYDELAQQHLNNDRYQDAAQVYLDFAVEHVSHPLSVTFFVKYIDAYLLGDFPSLAMRAKQRFVDTYGSVNGVWNSWSPAFRELSSPYLHQYLLTLSQAQHSLGQQLGKIEPDPSLPETLQKLTQKQDALEQARAYALAARYYREFIDIFPDDEQTPDIQFYLGEALFEAGKYPEAIAAYETFAYQHPEHPKAADGAYSALLAFDKEVPAQSSEQYNDWQRRQNTSRERFVTTFADDARSVTVIQTLMQEYFDDKVYAQSLYWSDYLLTEARRGRHSINDTLVMTARIVKAYSYYGMQDYAAAQTELDAVLQDLPLQDKRRVDLTDAYAVSVYRQAEALVAKDQLNDAVAMLSLIIEKAPDTATRVNAQYDAISYLLSLQQFERAESMLNDFKARFGDNPLAADVPEKLLYVYEQTGQWQAAADYYMQVFAANQENNTGRDALWQAADYYERANLRDKSLPAYRTYAHTFAQPFEQAVEARFKMSEFYAQSGEDSKRRYWLNKLMQIQDGAGNAATARSRTLAAMSAMVFANDAEVAFNNIKLTIPLKKSLQSKRKALDTALKAFDKVMAYGVRDYTTQANHRLGEIYRTLAQDLMDSERPQGLSALEQTQYDVLLEEQAIPFEDKAISVFEVNARRVSDGVYDDWVKQSFSALEKLMPARYRKPELIEEVSINDF